ncbi:MAG TPA: DUF3015 family protein [Dongiaceae bacterium]|nr:DUF3015 family protein [Dongiaceae bacterium]
MKKCLALTLAGGMIIGSAALASAAGYGTAGCGLGSLLFKDQPGIVQIFAATTNGTFGNQTFGITSGTLNCGAGVLKSQNGKAAEFAAANMDNLARDIAQGKGESLAAFAELMNVPASQQAAFNLKLQQNFDKIFTSDKVVAAQVVDTVSQLTAVN